jgi:transposase
MKWRLCGRLFYFRRSKMTKGREILRLHSQGISNRSIAVSLECSRNTVRKVLERAGEESIAWLVPELR